MLSDGLPRIQRVREIDSQPLNLMSFPSDRRNSSPLPSSVPGTFEYWNRKKSLTAALGLVNSLLLGAGGARAADPVPAPAPAPTPAPAPAPGNTPAAQTPAQKPGSTQLPPVVVTGEGGYKADSLSLNKYGEPLLTTPQSAAVVTNQLMKDQGVTTLRDSLRNVAGVSIGAGEGSYQGDNISIRGFAARSDIYLDGMSDLGNYNRDPFDLEEVEVLKGPSSAEFGRGSSGGVVNQVSKTPKMDPFIMGSLMYGTDRTHAATLDVNEPIPGMPHAAFRLNVMAHEDDVTDRDAAHYARWGIAPSLAFGIDTPTRLTINYLHQTENNTPDYGIPWLFDRPAPVSRQNFYGFGDDYLKTDVNIGTIRFEHDFNDSVTLREQFRVAQYHRSFRISQANTDDITASTPLSKATVGREIIDGVSNDRMVDEDINLLIKFDTGPIKHHLVTGFEYTHYSVDPRRIEPTWENVPYTSLLAPAAGPPFTGTGTTGTEVNATVNTYAAYAIDTMKIGEKFTFIAGLRYDRATSTYEESIAPTANFTANDGALTWRAAAVFQPQPNGSIYVASGTSFHPNIQQLSVSSEPTLPPETKNYAVGKNYEIEAGTKWDLLDGKLSLSGALFYDEQTNPAPVDLDDPLLDVLHGKERVRGIEFSAVGQLTPNWRLLLSYTLQDSAVTSSSDPTMIGSPVLNAPKHMFSLWTTYDLPWNFEIGFGANAVSSRTASLSPDTNGLLMEAPGYWIFSAMVKYHLTKDIDLQANVTNLTDKYYYDGVHPGHVVPGAGRTLYLSTNFKF